MLFFFLTFFPLLTKFSRHFKWLLEYLPVWIVSDPLELLSPAPLSLGLTQCLNHPEFVVCLAVCWPLCALTVLGIQVFTAVRIPALAAVTLSHILGQSSISPVFTCNSSQVKD